MRKYSPDAEVRRSDRYARGNACDYKCPLIGGTRVNLLFLCGYFLFMGKNGTGGSGFWYVIRNFAKKHRISLFDRNQETEVWYMYISPLRITLAVVGVLLVMFALVVTAVVYTPVLDSLPGYPGRQARAMLTENIYRLDSLERRLQVLQAYESNIGAILDGRISLESVQSPVADSVRGADTSRAITGPSQAEMTLRGELEGTGRYALVDGVVTPSGAVVKRNEFFVPVKGEIISGFDPGAGRFGIGIVPAGPQEVVAARGGTVVMSQWTPEDGNTIQIQHGDNYISFYKHNAQLLKMVGDRVEAGEVIGYVEPGVVDNATRPDGEFIFELWEDGVPVDPRRYMVFR